jgi:uncharacterized protein
MVSFGFFFLMSPGYLLIAIVTGLVAAWASMKVKSTFHKYSRIATRSGMTGAQVARMILDRNGLYNVPVERVPGMLSDHYDPAKRVLRLSPDVYDRPSVAAIGVAAHETGHALQHQQSYAPLFLRNAIAPTAMIASNLAFPLILIGIFAGVLGLAKVGIVLFSISVFFTLITLPVDFNASTRARAVLADYGVVSPEEADGVRKVLGAAAMTYLAAAFTAVLYLFFFLFRAGLLGGDE